MPTITHAFVIFALFIFSLGYPTANLRGGDSWAELKEDILKAWDDILVKYRAELDTNNTFVSAGELPNGTMTQTYRIKGDLKMRQVDTAEQTLIFGYNRDYFFEIQKSGSGVWTLEQIKILDGKGDENTVRFPEIEQDFMHGGLRILRPTIENAKEPTIRSIPGQNRIRLVFEPSEDAAIEVAELELDVSEGLYLPIEYSSRSRNGKSVRFRREWAVSASGIPQLVGGTSGEVHASNEPPMFDPTLSDKEFYVSYYGLPEPSLPGKRRINWWLVLLLLGGVVVAGFGYYLRSYYARN